MKSRVCVVGLGTVGYPTAHYIRNHGFQVYGYDVRSIDSEYFFTTTNWNKIPKNIEIYVITVSSGLKGGKPDLTNFYEVCSKVSSSNHDALICMESTVPVGTCRKLAEEFDLPNFVHVPHRYWSKKTEKFGVKQLRVFGALNKQSFADGLKLYKQLEIPLYPVSEIEIAEMCKIAENAYIFVQIAFVESLRMICEDLGLDFNSARKACNTKWNVKLLEALEGIGGSCLPKDIRYLLSHSNSDPLLTGAILIDNEYKKFRVKKYK